jgi:GT2 family glycosyltransferase
MSMAAVSRRGSERWALPDAQRPDEHPVAIDVLIPSFERGAELAVTLAGLAAQDDPPFRVIVSDQSPEPVAEVPAVAAMVRVLEAQGRAVRIHRHLPRRGLAEQRQFLFEQSSADAVLYLDDDIWLEPGTLSRMSNALDELGCGFVGSAPQGLSYLGDDRPHQRTSFEPWEGAVLPERVRRGTPAFERTALHLAANLAHVAAEHAAELASGPGWIAYKVAWVGACVLYRRELLAAAGAFDFWRGLPPVHSGEDVTAQWRVMERFGGAGILPSGAVHLESPTTVPDRSVDAFDVLLERENDSDYPPSGDTV